MQQERPLTIAEAARRFNMAEETLRRAAREGRLRAEKFGRAWVLSATEVGEWVAHGKHTPGRVSQPKPERPKRRPGRPRKE